MGPFDDSHLLIAQLHRRVLLLAAEEVGDRLQGLAVAGKKLGVSSNWQRRLRNWDAALGLEEKICAQSCGLVCQGVREGDRQVPWLQAARGSAGLQEGLLAAAFHSLHHAQLQRR